VLGIEGARLMRAVPTVAAEGAGVEASAAGVKKAMNVGSFLDAVRAARSR
jgi:hypothetical protein